MKSSPAESLPRWDTANIYSSLDGDDYRAAWTKLHALIEEIEAFFDAQGIRRAVAGEQSDAKPGDDSGTALEQANALSRLWGTLHAYVYTFVSTDSYHAVAARELSKLELLGTRAQKLRIRLQGWIGSLSERLPAWIKTHPPLAAHAFFLETRPGKAAT